MTLFSISRNASSGRSPEPVSRQRLHRIVWLVCTRQTRYYKNEEKHAYALVSSNRGVKVNATSLVTRKCDEEPVFACRKQTREVTSGHWSTYLHYLRPPRMALVVRDLDHGTAAPCAVVHTLFEVMFVCCVFPRGPAAVNTGTVSSKLMHSVQITKYLTVYITDVTYTNDNCTVMFCTNLII